MLLESVPIVAHGIFGFTGFLFIERLLLEWIDSSLGACPILFGWRHLPQYLFNGRPKKHCRGQTDCLK
jgi:hypothetical protein